MKRAHFAKKPAFHLFEVELAVDVAREDSAAIRVEGVREVSVEDLAFAKRHRRVHINANGPVSIDAPPEARLLLAFLDGRNNNDNSTIGNLVECKSHRVEQAARVVNKGDVGNLEFRVELAYLIEHVD